MQYYQNPLLTIMEDSLRHYDLPKKRLSPFSSDTLRINLLDVAQGFYPGRYKFRAHLRINTIRDNKVYNDEKNETAPPEDKIEYYNSRWSYFVVKKYISKHGKK